MVEGEYVAWVEAAGVAGEGVPCAVRQGAIERYADAGGPAMGL